MTRISIGFDRALRPEWLDRAAALAKSGFVADEARLRLLTELEGEFAGPEALAKAVLVLQRVWFPENDISIQRLRDDALEIVTDVTVEERLPIHWALLIATYPFFRDCIEVVGRLTRLQPQFTGVQLQRRLVDSWGDRRIIDRARQHVLQTLVFWSVLRMVSKRGIYEREQTLRVTDVRVARLLVRSTVESESSEMTMEDLLRAPVLFPFDFVSEPAEIFSDSRFGIVTSVGNRRIVTVPKS